MRMLGGMTIKWGEDRRVRQILWGRFAVDRPHLEAAKLPFSGEREGTEKVARSIAPPVIGQDLHSARSGNKIDARTAALASRYNAERLDLIKVRLSRGLAVIEEPGEKLDLLRRQRAGFGNAASVIGHAA